MGVTETIGRIFKPLEPPPKPEPLLLPHVKQDLNAYKRIDALFTRWKKACRGMLTDSAKPCALVKCPHRMDDSNRISSCGYWQVLKAELGEFDLDDANRRIAKFYTLLIRRATGIQNFFERYLTTKNIFILLITIEIAKAILAGLTAIVVS